MKIYISVPISGHPIKQQRVRASEIAERLKSLGHETVNPFDTPEAPSEMSKKEKYAYYMGEDIKQLLMCDAIYLCPGWTESKGCRLEAQIALIYGLQEYGRFEDVPKHKL